MAEDQNPPPNPERIRAFYDETYYRELPVGIRPSGHLRHLAEKVGIGPNNRVLDVACGTGEWLAACLARGAAISGIDLSERAIGHCRENLPSGHFETGSGEDLPFPDAEFDRISCLGSLEHFPRPDLALLEMRRVASVSARYLILVPNADFLTRRLGLYRGTYQTQALETVRTIAQWEALFADAGLEVIRRWRDLHVLSADWIFRRPRAAAPLRLMQASALAVWPLRWQYQVYFECQARH